MIPYNKQSIRDDDVESVKNSVRNEFLTQGPVTEKFERKLCEYSGCKFSTVVSSGTAALHLAYEAMGIKEGDIVWSPAISFVATTNSAKYCNAKVEFIEIEKSTGCVCCEFLEKKLRNTKNKDLPKVIVVVDYAGNYTDYKKIKDLSDKYNFYVLQDACHSFGGEYNTHKIGSCQYSDITITSFHAIKTITTGEGGAVFTNNEQFDEIVKSLRSHGIKKKYDKNEPWMYEQEYLGYNYRMTEIQASLGITQLSKIEKFIERRERVYKKYKVNLSKYFYFTDCEYGKSSRHLCSVLLNSKEEVLKFYYFFKDKKIMLQKHYIPIYKQPYYDCGNFKLENTEDFYNRQISLPLFVDITDEEVNSVISSVFEFYGD